MTNEEKIRAYDEALERARKSLRAASDVGTDIVTFIFPELAESEDERIRKEIIEFLTYGIWSEVAIEKVKQTQGYTKWIAYLEKQKEQKPVECIKFDNEFENQISHLIASVLNGEHEYGEGFVKYVAQSLLGYAKKEQKPAEINEYEIIKKHITRDSLSSEVNKRLKECGWYVTDEKPVEWSEEDEDAISGAIGILLDDNNPNFVFPEHSKLSVGEIVKRLKSLRPSWKPTEEQISVLDYAYCELFKRKDVGHDILGPLQKLCDELKKLEVK